MKKFTLLLLAVFLLVAGCAQPGSKQTSGAEQETISGGIMRDSIGDSMDQQDRIMTARSLENNQDGQELQWKNQNTGRAYTVTPTESYAYWSGQYCRKYQMTMMGGEEQKAYGYGMACRQPNGQWKIEEHWGYPFR